MGTIASITNERLKQLVRESELSENDAKSAGFAASLYHVLDGRPELVAAAKADISEVRELVKKDRAGWKKLIVDSKTKPPGGISADKYAELLAKKVEGLFPSDALAHRLATVKPDAVLLEHAKLAELRRLNPRVAVIGIRNFDSLKTDGIAAAELRLLPGRYAEVVRGFSEVIPPHLIPFQ